MPEFDWEGLISVLMGFGLELISHLANKCSMTCGFIKKGNQMTVKQLKELIKDMDDDRLVVLQSDSEGNGYNLCRGVDDNALYNCEREPYVGYEIITKELKAKGYTKEDIGSGVKAIVLFP